MKRILIKKDGNNFELITNDKEMKLKTVKGYNKKELKEIYSQLIAQKNGLLANQAQHKAELKKINVDDTTELRDFIKKIEAAQQLQQKTKLEEQLKMINADILKSIAEAKEIRAVIPELGRAVK